MKKETRNLNCFKDFKDIILSNISEGKKDKIYFSASKNLWICSYQPNYPNYCKKDWVAFYNFIKNNFYVNYVLAGKAKTKRYEDIDEFIADLKNWTIIE